MGWAALRIRIFLRTVLKGARVGVRVVYVGAPVVGPAEGAAVGASVVGVGAPVGAPVVGLALGVVDAAADGALVATYARVCACAVDDTRRSAQREPNTPVRTCACVRARVRCKRYHGGGWRGGGGVGGGAARGGHGGLLGGD